MLAIKVEIADYGALVGPNLLISEQRVVWLGFVQPDPRKRFSKL